MAKDIVQWANDSMGETEPITITLDGDGSTSVDFESAFGEFSEARGRGRARRQRRRLERIKRRQERRSLRRQGRMTAMQERQAIKSARKKAREERQGEDEEMPSEASNEMPMSDSGEGSNSEPTAESSYNAPVPSYSDENQQIDESVDSESGQSDEDSGFTGDYGFDGVRGMSELDGEYDNFYASAEGQAAIKPAVTEIARRIEKNKEWISRMQSNLDKVNARVGGGQPNPRQQERIALLTSRIAERKQKLAMLEEKLGAYSRMDGDFDNADGDYDNADGTNPRLEERIAKIRQRAEVRAAKRAARAERKQVIKGNLKGKRQARVQELFAELSKTMPRAEAMREARKRAMADITWKSTAVETDLNATMSPNRIEVPAQSSSFSGTGLIGVDDYNDFDAPSPRNLEVSFSNASGSGKIDWKNIAIGVGVAVIGIYVYRRFIKK